jgi:hypothetical protein
VSDEPTSVTTHLRNADHVGDALARLAGQFAGATRLRGLVTALATETQALEDAAWQVFAATLAAATDDALDQVGAVLGMPRGVLADDDYRAVLRATARARRSSGTLPDILATAALLFGESPTAPPAALAYDVRAGGGSVTLEPREVPAVSATAAIAVLRLAAAAGYRIQLFDPPAVEANLFAFSDDPLRVTSGDTSRGFANNAMSNGGQWTGTVA